MRFVKAREALVADGSVRRVGRVSVLRVYERPCCIDWSVYFNIYFWGHGL